MPPVNNKTLTRKQQDHKMKKQLLLIAILFCAVYTQAQEVFVNADFVSSYIWRGMDSGNASVQPSLGFNWKGLTVYAWGSTEFRHKNNEIDLSLEYEYTLHRTYFRSRCRIHALREIPAFGELVHHICRQ